ncbi:MAG: hypothetical protein AAFW84_33620 [Cyanobacteria bacterium J06635_15]
MNPEPNKPRDSIEEYTWVCDSLLGTFMDAIWGFALVGKDAQSALRSKTPNGKPPFVSFIPRPADPNMPRRQTYEEFQQQQVHMARADEVVKRNALDGHNSLIMAQMALITVFHYWEDKYRAMIASEFGLESKDVLKVDGVGDIRLLRISIVHNKGIAKKEVERTKRFRWFSEDDKILLDYDKMLEIKNYLMSEFYSECLDAIHAVKNIAK